MPQLDKLSFATQYIWLTFFFIALYWITIEFFAISTFRNLKLRCMIYKIWHFFLYKFDYTDYANKNKSIINTCFNFSYNNLHNNVSNFVKILLTLNIINTITNKLGLSGLYDLQKFNNTSVSLNNMLTSDINNLQINAI